MVRVGFLCTFALSKGRKDRSNGKTLKYSFLHNHLKIVNKYKISNENYNIF